MPRGYDETLSPRPLCRAYELEERMEPSVIGLIVVAAMTLPAAAVICYALSIIRHIMKDR